MKNCLRCLLAFVLLMNSGVALPASELPVKPPQDAGYQEVPEGAATKWTRGIRNLYAIEQLYESIKGGFSGGLQVDLNKYTKLLDGRKIDPKSIYGKIYFGPYPFEAKEVVYVYKRFRGYSRIELGKATAFLDLDRLLSYSGDSEDWNDDGQLVVRFDLMLKTGGKDLPLGVYDTFVRFGMENGKYFKRPTIIEGPMVNMIRSESPGAIVISFKTGEPVKSAVVLDNGKRFAKTGEVKKHEITVSGLEPSTDYRYRIETGGFTFMDYSFRTAPEPGKGNVVFAYSGDSREGIGGGGANFMGANYTTMERIANLAFNKKADLFVFGGDLMNGNTASPDDYRVQIHAWKQALAGFWNHKPVYSCMGNHESLLRVFKNKEGEELRLDRWPYDTESAEAVFADELVYPQNGPEASDSRRPTYSENVYSFQYGPVKFIAFNNNYWIAKSIGTVWQIPLEFGGCPEGYMMRDQMDWIKGELEKAEKDPTVKYIVLFAQEPVFPNGGHVKDCMWYFGNNKVRAAVYDHGSGKVVKESRGIIDIRNQFLRMVGNNKKVAVILGADEHSYHKMLLDKDVPVGVPETDDTDNSDQVCREQGPCSSLKDLKYPTWYMVSGGAGAPYYAQQETPWNAYWGKNPSKYDPQRHTSMRGCYHYSSQENVLIFSAGDRGLSVTVYNPYGGIIDKIDNLMSIKR